MQHALLDILTKHYADGTPVDHVAPEDQIYHSIQSHLSRLLNARRGSLQHMPDYGLPDVSEIYSSLPYSIQYLARETRRTIETYEPRLYNVKVTSLPIEERESIVTLCIKGELADGNAIEFATYFMAEGRAEIEPRKL